MYTTKNKYFTKHPLIKNLNDALVGESILLAETSPEWRKARKTLSPAFYKGKLENLVEIAKGSVRSSITQLKGVVKKAENGQAEIDLIPELSDILVRIMLMCAFGEDVS